jgi:hypothetical protein
MPELPTTRMQGSAYITQTQSLARTNSGLCCVWAVKEVPRRIQSKQAEFHIQLTGAHYILAADT